MSIQHSHTAACTWIKPRRQISTQDRLYLQNKNVKNKKPKKKWKEKKPYRKISTLLARISRDAQKKCSEINPKKKKEEKSHHSSGKKFLQAQQEFQHIPDAKFLAGFVILILYQHHYNFFHSLFLFLIVNTSHASTPLACTKRRNACWCSCPPTPPIFSLTLLPLHFMHQHRTTCTSKYI